MNKLVAVPTTIPINIANTKLLIASPPKKNIIRITSIVLTLVLIVLANVAFSESLIRQIDCVLDRAVYILSHGQIQPLYH